MEDCEKLMCYTDIFKQMELPIDKKILTYYAELVSETVQVSLCLFVSRD